MAGRGQQQAAEGEQPHDTPGDQQRDQRGARRPEHLRVVVVGAGFSGLGAAVRLRRAGLTGPGDFAVLERADAVGGTWRDNTYPGCACDVPSHLYSFSFAPNPDWPRNFSGQPHIRAYLEQVTDTFGLRPHIRFGSELLAARWDTAQLCWEIRTSRETLTADVLISATGPLSDPRIPRIPGLDGFPGKVFHSARWDHDYDLRGKRVAVVGTGASAIQFVPAIAPDVERLTLFQRTAPWVLPRLDRPTSAAERRLHRALPATRALRRGLLWAVREAQAGAFTRRPEELRIVEALARRHLARTIHDPELRARLTPDYRIGCKRILLSNTYYPALTRPQVDLIPAALKEVRGSTLVASDGTRTEADAIVFGTGFRVTDTPIAQRITGADGTTLAGAYRKGTGALRGTTAAGFPNFLTLIGPNTGLGNSSMILIIEAQLNYLIDYLDQLRRLGGRGLDNRSGSRTALTPRLTAVRAWNDRVQRRMAHTVWTTGGCHSWYLDSSGRNTTLWPGTTAAFRRAVRRVDLSEYEVLRAPGPAPAATPAPTPAATAGAPRPSAHRFDPPPPAAELTAVSADGAPLHVELHGPEDAPAVVLVHGWTCSTAYWAAVIRALSADHRVIAYDQRGHGRSPAAPGTYRTEVLADDLCAVLDTALPEGRRAVLAGHSMGGMTLMAAAGRPRLTERAAAVLLCSTGSSRLLAGARVVAVGPARLRNRIHGALLGSPAPLGPVTPLSQRLLKYGTMSPGAAPERVEAVARIVHACPRKVRAEWAGVLAGLDVHARLGQLTAPTRLLAGTADRLTPLAHSRRIAEALPYCLGLTELHGVGHMTAIEAPEAVTAAIRQLVTSHTVQPETEPTA